ncbi:MAG: hypothetical protein WBA17_14285, partial [Saprospiraceae bacterium]
LIPGGTTNVGDTGQIRAASLESLPSARSSSRQREAGNVLIAMQLGPSICSSRTGFQLKKEGGRDDGFSFTKPIT